VTLTDEAPAPARLLRPPPRRGAAVAVGFGALLLVVVAVLRLAALGPDDLHGDYGIQYHLSAQTARGAIPIIDFEHGWNWLGWYAGAVLWWLARGSATVWMWLWQEVTAGLLAGLAVLAIAWRLRLSAAWILGLAVSWLWLTDVVNGKYAIPTLWLLAVLPVGRLTRGWAPVAVRFALAGVTLWAHVDLAVMLSAGVALYDLFGARGLTRRERGLRVGALAAGGLVAFALQLAVYATLGMGPAALIRFLVLDRSATDPAQHFGYPLLDPTGLRSLAYPLTLVLGFAPLVWRRLSEPTRVAVMLHLAMALTAIRKPDTPHIAAASTLLAVVVVLAVRDLFAGARPLPEPTPGWQAALGLLGGVVWFALAIVVGFTTTTLLAAAALAAVCLAGVAMARRGDLVFASAGAGLAALALVVVALGSHAGGQVPGPADDLRAQQIALEAQPEVERCLGAGRAALVVPQPLGLYDYLGVSNPTPFYLFWPGFRHEAERVLAMIDDGTLPAVIQVNDWPPVAFDELGPAIEARMDRCAELVVATTGDRVTVWVRR
jgi:hypothetical protein